MVIDPVCARQIDEKTADLTSEYRGQTYYFDSEHCQRVFESDPAEYVAVIPTISYGDQGQRFEK